MWMFDTRLNLRAGGERRGTEGRREREEELREEGREEELRGGVVKDCWFVPFPEAREGERRS